MGLKRPPDELMFLRTLICAVCATLPGWLDLLVWHVSTCKIFTLPKRCDSEAAADFPVMEAFRADEARFLAYVVQ
jgi:hypothetical protein